MELLEGVEHGLQQLALRQDGGAEVVGAGLLPEARARHDADACNRGPGQPHTALRCFETGVRRQNVSPMPFESILIVTSIQFYCNVVMSVIYQVIYLYDDRLA